MPRTDLPPTFDERAMLTTFLAYTRSTARAKVEGVAEEFVGAAPLATSPLTTLGGVLNHLRWVEYSWLQTFFLQLPDESPWPGTPDPDIEFRQGAEMSVADLLAAYDAECERSDRTIAAHDLQELAPQPLHSGDRVTLGWIVMHLIEETARHTGHLDLLRELADGSVGS